MNINTNGEQVPQGRAKLHHHAGIWNGVLSYQFIESNWMDQKKGSRGVIVNTQTPQNMATRVYSMNTTHTLINDLQNMIQETENVQTHHMEEVTERITKKCI